jgi:pimeloyl-ACP methyl ester carboxylesterase
MMPAGLRRSLVEVGDDLPVRTVPSPIRGRIKRDDPVGLRMVVSEVGEGKPVFLLHGNPSWSFLWRKVAVALSGAPLRLIMPDLVGLGYSDKPRDPAQHTLENHARWIGALMDRVVPGPMIAVVQDWGGAIAMRALADRPERLAGLVVLNTALSPPRPGFKASRFHRFAQAPLVSQLAFRLLGFPQNAMFSAQGDRSSIRCAGSATEPRRSPSPAWSPTPSSTRRSSRSAACRPSSSHSTALRPSSGETATRCSAACAPGSRSSCPRPR